jgi:hypothetical protein
MSHILAAGTLAPDFTLKVSGKPTFFINGRRHDGSYQFQDLVAAIDSVLYAKVQHAKVQP